MVLATCNSSVTITLCAPCPPESDLSDGHVCNCRFSFLPCASPPLHDKMLRAHLPKVRYLALATLGRRADRISIPTDFVTRHGTCLRIPCYDQCLI